MSVLQGCCACGEIEFQLTSSPINVAYCYCTACQIHTNSDKWYGLWVRHDDFQLVKGEPQKYTRKGDSGRNMVHHFCKNCGTAFAIFVEIGGFFSVAGNTLKTDNPPKPVMLIYTKNASQAAMFPEGVAKYDILPPEMM